MARTHTKVVEMKPYPMVQTSYTCDKCGTVISDDGDDGDYSNDLVVLLNGDKCVHSGFRRDYCADCLGPVWDAICALIGADPDDISNSDFSDDF